MNLFNSGKFAFLAALLTFSFVLTAKADSVPTAEEVKIGEMITRRVEYSKISGMAEIANHLAKLSLSCQAVSDCVAFPMGSRACGGPTAYVITSMLNPSLDAVKETISMVTKAEKDANKKYRLASVCSFEMPPDMTCVENTCGTP